MPTLDTELCNAVMTGNTAAVAELLGRGASPHLTLVSDSSPWWNYLSLLAYSVYQNQPKIVELLLKKGANANQSFPASFFTCANWSLLTFSIYKSLHKSRHETTKLLLQHGASPHQTLSGGWFFGSWEGYPLFEYLIYDLPDVQSEIIKLFINKGINPNYILTKGSYAGWSVLAFFIHNIHKSQHEELAEFMLEQGANPHQTMLNGQSMGWTLLSYATYSGTDRTVAALLKKYNNRNHWNSDGTTPLHVAAKSNRLEIGKLLLSYGFPVNIGDEFGKTPLHYALTKFSTMLLLKGAKFDIKDKSGDTAYDLAIKSRNTALCGLMLSLGADETILIQKANTPVIDDVFFKVPAQSIRNEIRIINSKMRNHTASVITNSINMISHGNLDRRPLEESIRDMLTIPELEPLLEITKLAVLGYHNLAQGYFSSRNKLNILIDTKNRDLDQATLGVATNAGGLYFPHRIPYMSNTIYACAVNDPSSTRWNRSVLIHEITHFIAEEVYNNRCDPYFKHDYANKEKFAQICNNIRNRSHNDSSIQAVFSFSGYSEISRHRELIARVPELIVYHGIEYARTMYPDLFAYYKDVFLVDCRKHIENLKLKNNIHSSSMNIPLVIPNYMVPPGNNSHTSSVRQETFDSTSGFFDSVVEYSAHTYLPNVNIGTPVERQNELERRLLINLKDETHEIREIGARSFLCFDHLSSTAEQALSAAMLHDTYQTVRIYSAGSLLMKGKQLETVKETLIKIHSHPEYSSNFSIQEALRELVAACEQQFWIDLKSDDDKVRENAIYKLSLLPFISNSVYETLLSVMKSDTFQTVRIRAAEVVIISCKNDEHTKEAKEILMNAHNFDNEIVKKAAFEALNRSSLFPAIGGNERHATIHPPITAQIALRMG